MIKFGPFVVLPQSPHTQKPKKHLMCVNTDEFGPHLAMAMVMMKTTGKEKAKAMRTKARRLAAQAALSMLKPGTRAATHTMGPS